MLKVFNASIGLLSLIIAGLSLYVAVLQLQTDQHKESNHPIRENPIDTIQPSLRISDLDNQRDSLTRIGINKESDPPPREPQIIRNWLVIGCSHKKGYKNSKANANKTNELIKEKGFVSSKVIDSEGLDGFKCCYWSCIVNSYENRNDANKTLQNLKDAGIKAYIKRSSAIIKTKDPNDYKERKTGLIFKRIPTGIFTMGSNENSDEMPPHKVSIPSFYMSETEVTTQQYYKCVSDGFCTEPRTSQTCNWMRPNKEHHPINCVSWSQARRFAKYLGDEFDLPTEAEWEYAALGNQNYTYSGSNQIYDVAWFSENSSNKTHPVRKKKPNAFGLFDMSGNIWEWTLDEYRDNYLRAPSDGSLSIGLLKDCRSRFNCSGKSNRVGRGGSFKYKKRLLRIKQRRYSGENKSSDMFGFRVKFRN